MLVTLPVYQGDVQRLKNLLVWIRQLGGCAGHNAYIVADGAMLATDAFALRDEALRSFKAVGIVNGGASTGWPQGPNTLFLKAAEVGRKLGQPWLFLEPDAVPLCPGWLDKIEAEYWLNNAEVSEVAVADSTRTRGVRPPLSLD